MNVVVCVKQVPDTTEVRIDPETNTLVREGVPAILNPYDEHATEEAVRLKERYGGTVTALTMGPPQAADALRKCISIGVDRGILLSDRSFAGADTWATSYTLAAAIRKLGEDEPVDLVLCGKQAIDGDTAQVGPGIAQRLGCSQLTYVVGVDDVSVEPGRVRVQRRLEAGVETVEADLPALLTCVEEINDVRYASMPNMIRAARYEPDTWIKGDLDVEEGLIGLDGSPTAVSKVFAPPTRPPGEIVAGPDTDPEAAAAMLLDRIVEAAQSLAREDV
jgi:electron transfer flavoprotein beta subunit